MPPDNNPIQDVELAERLVRIEASIEQVGNRIDSAVCALRADVARYFDTLQDHEIRIRGVEKEQSHQSERLKGQSDRLGSLSDRVNAWGVTNSVGALVAGIVGWFK